MEKQTKFTIYRIYYNDQIVYVGRTKQPLQNRIRGHLFSKPMHRTINIDLVTKIECSELDTEADMNLYELYYILKYRPPLNVDDKARDNLTISLPEIVWTEFKTPLWEKWAKELHRKNTEYEANLRRYRHIPEEISILRSEYRTGRLSEEDYFSKLDAIRAEQERLRKEIQ